MIGKTEAQQAFEHGERYYFGRGVHQNWQQAAQYYQKAAENGHAEAQFALGECYYYGHGVSIDYTEAVKYLQQAVAHGSALAQRLLGVCHENGNGTAKDLAQAEFLYAQALPGLRDAAERGNPRAKFGLGWSYHLGKGLAENPQQAVAWYQKAANQGHAPAQTSLGWCYANGKGVTQNYQQAVAWFQKAANQGHAWAQTSLGWCYDDGKGVTQDLQQAVAWYQKAAKQGHALAQCNLGNCYHNGNGVPQNYQQAVAWLQKAANQGHAPAQHNLGVCYENGRGVPQNYPQAIAWFQKAAKQGDAFAQCNLGNCYHNGNGVPQNYQQAVAWLQKAAEQGQSNAQNSLTNYYNDQQLRGYLPNALLWHEQGKYYDKGEKVRRDVGTACKYYKKAAELGNPVAQMSLAELLDQHYSNYSSALDWYQKAEQRGYPGASAKLVQCHYNLGRAYEQGNCGMNQNKHKALTHYQQAATLGYGEAAAKVKQLTPSQTKPVVKAQPVAVKPQAPVAQQPKPTPKHNDLKQVELYLSALMDGDSDAQASLMALVEDIKARAQGNDSGAQFTLGRLYEQGRGVIQNYDHALLYFFQAAEQQHFGAITVLQQLMKTGAVPEENRKLIACFLKAQQGDAEAQLKLGLCCAKGKSIEPSKAQAIFWLEKAAKQGNEQAARNLSQLQGATTGGPQFFAGKPSTGSANTPSGTGNHRLQRK